MIRTGLTKFLPAASGVVLMLMVLGCAQSAPRGSSYVLSATRQGEPALARGAAILEVRRFSIDAEFATRGLVYRTDEFKFETDFYHEFLISPALMITEKTRDWLSRAGLFDQVLVPGSRLEPTYTLDGNIVALYGDLRDPAAPMAVMELRCFLVADEESAQTVVFAHDYKSTKPLESNSADALVTAFDACLVEILTNLEKGLEPSITNVAR
jgi:cholesterol transport system auxiliary component